MVTHSMSTSWKVKQKYLIFARKDLNVKARRAAVSNKQTVNSKYKKINKRDYLPIPSIYPYKHTSQSVSDGERRKRSAQGASVKVSVEDGTITGERQLFQFLRTIMKDEELPNKFVPIDAQHYKHVSLSQTFHVGQSQEESVAPAATAPPLAPAPNHGSGPGSRGGANQSTRTYGTCMPYRYCWPKDSELEYMGYMCTIRGICVWTTHLEEFVAVQLRFRCQLSYAKQEFDCKFQDFLINIFIHQEYRNTL
ncbi:hypothetical protein UY3_09262 [Chelonia mydas]|uniref:Uncharacterized protein n=1 Tax=Chelonia mydas TaxID=8469 RepID=M7B6F4_CHEMY|nr:hypothetical protein UY3_09262 [Chelonia mydas]